MLRATLIAAVSLAALASSRTALADDVCMSAPRSPRLAQSLDIGPFFSSDGTTLISRLVSREWVSDLGLGPGATEREPLAELLWCWDASDPRCSPRTPSPDDALRGLESAHGALATGETKHWPMRGRGDTPPRSRRLGGPREGVRARVERPPCA